MRTLAVLSLFALLLPNSVSQAEDRQRLPVILDTDIGAAIDDAFGLSLALSFQKQNEIDLLAVTTCTSQAEERAWMVCRFLTSVDCPDVPVAFGREPQPKSDIDWQIQYRRHPAVVWNRTTKPAKEPAEDLMQRVLAEHAKRGRGGATIIAIGPLTNVARLLNKHPESRQHIDRIVLMGGSLKVGYNGRPPAIAEWNIKSDVPAAQAVFNSGLPLVIAPLDAGVNVTLSDEQLLKLFSAHTPITWELQSLVQLWEGQRPPTLFDPIAVRLALDDSFCKTQPMHLSVDDKGKTHVTEGKPNATVVTELDSERFERWFIKQVSSAGKEILPQQPQNRTKTIKRRGLPRLVHAFEDYDNDIERRWWMTGKLETKDVPPTSRRASRAVLTQDYDAKMGDTQSRYKAVIFNPVPGPPMGENPRLSFRYKLSGTDTLRVQLFSLSNGYHRYLSLTGLPQDEWTEATVDMTDMRRPDGSGGPLAADERIDDIQFYIDPRADLIVDEMILYDEAPRTERRPFPRRLLFTGWFDTGKQGNEWPGDFEIVLHDKPRTWDAAKSVVNDQTGQPWIRLHLRGSRRLDDTVNLRFHYKLSGADKLTVRLVDSKSGHSVKEALTELKTGEWTEATLSFDLSQQLSQMPTADEIQILLPAKAELLIDDLLLYVP